MSLVESTNHDTQPSINESEDGQWQLAPSAVDSYLS